MPTNRRMFLYIFPVALIGLFALLNFLPLETLFLPMIEITGSFVAFLSNAIGVPATWYNDNWTVGILIVSGFKMIINIECTAVHFFFIFIAAAAATPEKTWGEKTKAIIIGLVILFTANAIRIIMAGIAGSYSPKAFRITHDFIWQGLYIFLVFFLWFYWVKGVKLMNITLRKAVLGLFMLLAVYAAMALLATPYSYVHRFLVNFIANSILDLNLTLYQTGNRISFAFDWMDAAQTLPNMFIESLLFYALTILTMTRYGINKVAASISLGFVLMLISHVAIFVITALMFNIAMYNIAVTKVVLRTFAVCFSYVLWQVLYYRVSDTDLPPIDMSRFQGGSSL